MKVAILSKSTGKWDVREVSISGGYFAESLSGNVATKLVDKDSSPGSIVSTIPTGTTLHFYSSSRISIDPADFGGAIVSYDAKIVSQSGKSTAIYIVNSGLDYWRDTTCGYEAGGKSHYDAFVGSFQMLSKQTKGIYGTTLSRAELTSAQVPLRILSGDDLLKGKARAIGPDAVDIADFSSETKDLDLTLKGDHEAVLKINGGAAHQLEGFEGAWGGRGNDKLTGDAADNVFRGNGGRDKIDGKGGFDFVDYSNSSKKVFIALEGGRTAVVKINGVAIDAITNVEGVVGRPL